MRIRSECFCIPRAPVTFTVSVTMTGTARPAGSNTQERRIKERLVVTLQRKGSPAVNLHGYLNSESTFLKA